MDCLNGINRIQKELNYKCALPYYKKQYPEIAHILDDCLIEVETPSRVPTNRITFPQSKYFFRMV